ncbi:caspase, EACC1-associated type [Streptomyces sp. NPDC002446]
MTDRDRYALVVVTGTYLDVGLGALRAPTDDAESLAEVLGDTSIGDFDVEVLTDPTVQQLRIAVEDFFADRRPQDTLLLHFSCHGVKNAAGKLFLATTDTSRARLASTAIPAEYVSSLMLASRAQRAVLLLDCCYAGAFERGLFARAGTDAHVQDSFQDLERTGGRRGRAVFTASSAVEFAFEGDRPVAGGAASQGNPSLFTGALVEGLRTGDADRDGDGEVGVSELADYVGERLQELTPHQTPQLWVFGAHGDLPIARTRRARPAALPRELADAVHSESRERRLWAVGDLGSLLRGEDVGLALSACAALSELERDDSRRVADGAARALGAAQPEVGPPSLDLGRAVVGVPGPPALLRVEGPPIVLATMEARADPWLKIRYVEGGIELAAEVSERGEFAGTVRLQSATGELAIPVQAEAVTQRRPRRQPEPTPRVPKEPAASRPPPATEAAADQPTGGQVPVTRRLLGTVSHWSFLAAAAAMVLALILPMTKYGSTFEIVVIVQYRKWAPLQGAWAWASAVTCVAAAVCAARGSSVLQLPSVRWWYTIVALVNLGVTILWWRTGIAYGIRIGLVALTAACVFQLWGSLYMWLCLRRRRPSADSDTGRKQAPKAGYGS